VGLFILVTFGCCMDIAAIQSGTPFRLDFNAELATVGLSNVATGALGAGFTGSFIFRWAPRGVGRWQPVQRVVVAWRGGWVLDRWCRQLGPAAPASLPASWSLAACHSRPLAGSMRRSQTIFTGGAGVQSRLNGAVIALSELALFATPFSVVQYLPRFFFGGLLVW
jgi:MFS superfamily sulfate permease-like transporter